MDGDALVDRLGRRTVREAIEANPALGRTLGDHRCDGILPDVSPAALARHEHDLDLLLTDLLGVGAGRTVDDRLDLATAATWCRNELFHLRVLRDPHTDPQWALWRGAEVAWYVARQYAPAHDRAEALTRHLEQLPDWLPAALALVDPEIAEGPRAVAVESARGHASFYRAEVRPALGDLGDRALERRLDAAVEAAAAAVSRHADALAAIPAQPAEDAALGGERFCAMLEAQEGVAETVPSLRRRAEAELDSLTGRAEVLAGQLGAGSPAEAFARMERRHPEAGELLDTASAMLDRLRETWTRLGAVTIPQDIGCTVRATPAFLSYITAAYEPPGPLDPPDLPHYYFITPAAPEWSAQEREDWLRHLNHASLENITIHEVYPGHFVHCVAANRQPRAVRQSFWWSGFGEGWAHYAEQLAVEQGLAAADPWLELAMLQDALLRACRFRAALGLHAEGMSLEGATTLFEERSHVPRLAAEREALRGTYDPMYLVYTYGKLEILSWRERLERRPGFSLRRFHDRMIELGYCPLSVVRQAMVGEPEAGAVPRVSA